MSAAPTLWQRAALTRAKTLLEESNRSARARLVLVDLLRRCGQKDVDLVAVHTWSRRMQGLAYLWAVNFLNGQENVPPPWTP